MVELWQASMPSEWKYRFGGVDILVYSHYCVLVENSEVNTAGWQQKKRQLLAFRTRPAEGRDQDIDK
jgi:hypothetical protein